MFLMDLLKGWQLGAEVSNPANWKKGQILTTAVGGLVILALKYLDPDQIVTPEMSDAITEGICYFLIAFNVYLTKATSKKV